jgi:hypothetical protein
MFNLSRTRAVNGVEAVREYVAAGTIVAGEWVVLGADGTITAADASSAALLGMAKFGGATGDTILVTLATPDVEFLGTCTSTVSAALLGDFVDLEIVAGVQFINEDAGSTKVLQINSINDVTAKTVWVSVAKSQASGTEV